jgi:hypothetical protein
MPIEGTPIPAFPDFPYELGDDAVDVVRYPATRHDEES